MASSLFCDTLGPVASRACYGGEPISWLPGFGYKFGEESAHSEPSIDI